MALASTGVWELRGSGSDDNAGFYNPVSGGTDYSQQNAAALSLNDVATDGSATLTSATGGFAADMVGNGISVAGTIYEIVALVDTHTITLDRSAPALTGQSARVGGALGSPGFLAPRMAQGNQVWLRGLFEISVLHENVSSGFVYAFIGGTGSNANAQGMSKWEGYGTVRGDGGKATLKAVVSSPFGFPLFVFINGGATFSRIKNVIFDGDNLPGIIAISGGWPYNWTYAENCIARNCTNGGFRDFSSVYKCEIQNCSGFSGVDSCLSIVDTIANGQSSGECAIHARSGKVTNCLIYNCSTPGFKVDAGGSIQNCRAYNCSNGFELSGYPRDEVTSGCLAWGCTFRSYSNGLDATLIGCAGGGATYPDVNATGVIPLTENPFVDTTNLDFRLTPAATAQLYAAGMNLQTDWLLGSPVRRSIEL